MSLNDAIIQFIHGFKDSYSGCIKSIRKQNHILINTKQQNKKIESNFKLRQRIIESCILNGLFLLFCIILFNYILLPTINWFLFKILKQSNYNQISEYLNSFLFYLFSFIWIMPVFLLSKLFNILCYQDIADISYQNKYGKPKLYEKSSISDLIADSIFSCILQVIFLMQSSIMVYLPIYGINQFLFHLHISLLYSLYAFEYKWINMGWNIRERLNYIETKWPYYFGFGLSLSIITSISTSYILNATLFAFLFPALLISAIEADCYELNVNKQSQMKLIFTSMHLFDVCIFVTDRFFRFIKFLADKSRSRKAKQQQKNEVKPNVKPILDTRKVN